MKKRIISLLLCLVLTVSLVPAAAAADTGDARTVTVRYASGHGVDTTTMKRPLRTATICSPGAATRTARISR